MFTDDQTPVTRPSRMFSLMPLVGCVLEAENMMRPMLSSWRSVNQLQRSFLDSVVDTARLIDVPIPEFDSTASWKNTDLMDFLAKHGVPIQIDEFDPNQFGMAATLCSTMCWKEVGEPGYLFKGNDQYSSFRLTGDQIAYFGNRSDANPVARVTAQNEDHVFVCKAPSGIYELDEIALGAYAKEFIAGLQGIKPFEGVKIPTVSYDVTRDVPWLVGLNADTSMRGAQETATVFEAKQRLIWKMNHKGAILKTGGYAGCTLESCYTPNDLVIDDEFLLIVMRPGIPIPFAVGIVTPADWKNPGDIEELA